MKERLLFNGVAGERGDQAVDERVEGTATILPRATPAYLALGQQAAPFARKAAGFIPG